LKKKIHTTKEQARIIVEAFSYLIANWKSILIIYGTIGTLLGTGGTMFLNKVVIPSFKPVVRPIVKSYTMPNKIRIDSIVTVGDSLKNRIRILERDFKLFHRPD